MQTPSMADNKGIVLSYGAGCRRLCGEYDVPIGRAQLVRIRSRPRMAFPASADDAAQVRHRVDEATQSALKGEVTVAEVSRSWPAPPRPLAAGKVQHQNDVPPADGKQGTLPPRRSPPRSRAGCGLLAKRQGRR